MKHLPLPLFWIVITADGLFWWNHDAISNNTFWIGEDSCYTVWVAAFLIFVKFPVNGWEKKAIELTLWGWIPYCLYAIYKQHTGTGSERSPWDGTSAILSGLFIIGQILWWWYKSYKAKKSR